MRRRRDENGNLIEEKSRNLLDLLRDPTFRQFLQSAKPYRWLYVILITAGVAGTAHSLLVADTFKRLLNLAPHIPAPQLRIFIATLTALSLFRVCLTFITSWFSSMLNESVVYTMRRSVLNQLQHLPLGWHENNHSSNATNIMYQELEVTKNFIVSQIPELITLPISFIAAVGYLFTVHPSLAIIALTVGPLQLLSNLMLRKRMDAAWERQRKVSRDVFHLIGETLQGIREVKANQLEARINGDMALIEKRGVAYNVELTQIRSVRNICRTLPGEVANLVGIAISASLMAQGYIGPGGLVAFFTLLDRVAAPFTTMVGVVNSLQETVSGAKKLYEVMELPQENTEIGETLPDTAPELSFDSVSFTYEKAERQTLTDVTFTLPKGKSLALVGPSGSGKSTLVKLLYRFYDADAGKIGVDDRDIRDFSLHSLRGNLALVSQEIFLFDATVRENIALGRADATDEDIERAAKLAQAHDFIAALPKGYDSDIGERGIKLSHGQKQRLSIARAILRNASMLILDEPTSALDVETEAAFQSDLGTWADGCTKIIIAHRLSTIRDADYVLFLEEGRVVEFGTPVHLLREGGRFRTFWEKQDVSSMANEAAKA